MRALLYVEQHYVWRKESDSHLEWERAHPMHTRFVRALVAAIRQWLVEDALWGDRSE